MSERSLLALSGVALLAVFAVATTIGPFSDTTVNDLYVYEQYARLLHDGRLPYIDFPFEYPPLAALPLWLAGIFGRDPASIEWTFGVLMALCLVAGQQLAACLAGGGRDGLTVAWLLVLTPVLIGASVRTHFDPLPIAITLAGLLMLARERRAGGFVLLGVGTMTKLFPGLLAVVALAWLAGRGEWREAVRLGAIFTAVVLAISLPFAGAGYVDSFQFHLDRPVQIESTAASVLFALGGSDVTGTNLRPDRFKSNGLDGGHADSVEALFAVLLVLAMAAIVLLAARRRSARHMVLCGFAALLAFVTLGKVFSPQYVIWLAPFAALAWVWGQRAVAALVTAAIVLTHVEFPSRYFDLINAKTDVVLIVAARNALLLAALALLVASLARPRLRACDAAPGGHDAPDAEPAPSPQPRADRAGARAGELRRRCSALVERARGSVTAVRRGLLHALAPGAPSARATAAAVLLALAFAGGCGGVPGELTVTTELPGGGAVVDDGDAGQTEVRAGDCANAETRPTRDNLSTIRRATLCLVNAERVKRDRGPLEVDGQLADAARAKAADMVENRYFAHTGPDGRTVRDWVGETDYLQGVRRVGLGENLGWASERAATPLRLVEGWMNSPGHRQNILRAEWDETGIGVALGAPREEGGGGATYVQLFGYRGG